VTLVLDASALIAHLDGSDAHHDAVEALLLGATGQALAASPITLAEVLVGPARSGQLDRAGAALGTLGVQTDALDADSPARLATLRARTGLTLPDCCVLVAAQALHAAVVTFDDRLAAAGRTLDLEVLGA
jgi:predicted nucleic acid-binding protein